MSKNLRLCLLLGVLFVLLVTAGVVFYPTVKGYFKKEENKSTDTVEIIKKEEPNKKELVVPSVGETIVPKTEKPVPVNVTPPGPLPVD